MTRNLFLGADLAPLFGALDVTTVAAVAGGIWRDVQASRFPERAVSLAGEIIGAHADVVALQEVSLYRSQMPGDWVSGASPNATKVDLDFLQVLLDVLTEQGGRYQAAAIGVNADEELPATTLDGATFDIRLTDRDVILVKDGLSFASGPSGTFTTLAGIPLGASGGATLTFNRGFVTADVSTQGRSVRVVDSHLEVGERLGRVQEAQARELLAALAAMSGPLILAGDFNSPADASGTESYTLLTTLAGPPVPFRDVWPPRDGSSDGSPFDGPAGFTCCLDPRASVPSVNERIDLILVRGGVQPTDVTVVEPTKTRSGLWPSDHLGVAANLEIQ
jgi:endonuclease/exonuclease/phosphatase family metal-dependent hydrolase